MKQIPAVQDSVTVPSADPSAAFSPNLSLVPQSAHQESLDFQNICTQQLARLCSQLPAIAARIVFWHPAQNASHSTDWHAPASEFEFEFPPLSDLTAGIEIGSPQPNSDHNESKTTAIRHLPSIPENTLYFLPLGQTNHPEYVLLKTQRPLLNSERISLQHSAHHLRDFLLIVQESDRCRHQAQEATKKLRKLEHQLRNPLAAIELFASVLSMELSSSPLQQHADSIQTVVADMADRLEQIVRGDAATEAKTCCDLHDIFTDAITILRPRWQAKDITISLPDKPTTLLVKRSQLQQAIENLLDNAIAYSPARESITCNWRNYNKEISVEIRDRGPGLSSQDLTSVFLPHYSRRPGGSGMGLTITKTYISNQGGDIWCQNIPNGGAQFSYTLKTALSDCPPP